MFQSILLLICLSVCVHRSIIISKKKKNPYQNVLIKIKTLGYWHWKTRQSVLLWCCKLGKYCVGGWWMTQQQG